MRFTLGILLLGACLLPLQASAGPLQVGGGVTVGVLGFKDSQVDTSSLFWGGHARVRVFKYLGGEMSLQTRKDSYGLGNGEISLRTKPLQFSVLVYPLAMLPVTPYFVAGTGWYYFTLTVSGDLGLPFVYGEGSIKLTERVPHVGIGVEAFLGDHFAVGADVRKIYLDFSPPLSDFKFETYFVNIGATFYF
jgi:hypothetical protein